VDATAYPTFRSRRLCLRLALAATASFVAVPLHAATETRAPLAPYAAAVDDRDGRDTRVPPSRRPTVEAAFARESYAHGDLARLVIWTSGRHTSLRIFRAGTEQVSLSARDVMLGSSVSTARRVGDVARGDVVWVPIGDWPGGLYFAKLMAAGGKVGYAPFVLRPRVFGENRVAVVLPTMTWQAYNFHDDDRDGVPDTWYQDQNNPTLTARLDRPYENRGVIPHYKYYDQPFIRWLVAEHPDVDYLADADLARVSTTGRKLAAYALIVFPGHHEYVTRHEYDVVTAFRNLGGSLMFLSANNFYRNTVKTGTVMRRMARWRDLGRPEAALVGTQYFDNDSGEHRGPWIVRSSRAARWIFAGTALHPGARFASGGIEGDEVAPSSPRTTTIVASIPNLFGTGHDANMTYYETARGARVFAAGAFTLAGAVWWKDVGRVVENVWDHLGGDAARADS
jgi:hypothetical protein